MKINSFIVYRKLFKFYNKFLFIVTFAQLVFNLLNVCNLLLCLCSYRVSLFTLRVDLKVHIVMMLTRKNLELGFSLLVLTKILISLLGEFPLT